MRNVLQILVIALLSACGSSGEKAVQKTMDESPDSGSREPGASDDEGEDSEPLKCRTVELINQNAGEKVNSAMCFGLAYDDSFSCAFYSLDNITECIGFSSIFVVVWFGNDFGEVYSGETYLADVIQGSTGAFEIYWEDGDTAFCSVTGDVARLCFLPD